MSPSWPDMLAVVAERSSADVQSEADRFDRRVVVACLLLVIGAYLDGWSHHNLVVSETFFTPWHAVLYSGFGALAGLVTWRIIRNRPTAGSWLAAVPPGYDLSVIGMFMFLWFGVADLVWHEVFGIETDVAALISPTHLGLDFAGALMITGPLRAGWRRKRPERRASWPMVLSVTALLALLCFVVQFASPLGVSWMGTGYRPAEANAITVSSGNRLSGELLIHHAGVPPMILYSALLMGCVLLLMARRDLGLGHMLAIVAGPGLAMVGMRYRFLSPGPSAIAAGVIAGALAAEVLRGLLHPTLRNRVRLHAFAFGVPVAVSGSYCVAVMWSEGTWWPIHLWTGSIVLSGFVGLLLSALVTAVPTARDDALEAPKC